MKTLLMTVMASMALAFAGCGHEEKKVDPAKVCVCEDCPCDVDGDGVCDCDGDACCDCHCGCCGDDGVADGADGGDPGCPGGVCPGPEND